MRKMNDHHMDIGKGRKGSVFPEEVHTKELRNCKGAGTIMDYPDTEEKIYRDQEAGIHHAEKRKLKAGYRY